MAVVVAFDELEHGRAEFADGAPRASVDKFLFEGYEKRLGNTVVETDTGAPHGRTDAVAATETPEKVARVLSGFKGSWQQCLAGVTVAAQ